MKHATVLIFSAIGVVLAVPGLRADCTPLLQITGARSFWQDFEKTYGVASFPKELTVCTGKQYFHEIKDGAKMHSALDRARLRILRRENKLKFLRHELAHAYLDVRWQVLPYSVSEPLVAAMEGSESCALPEMKPIQKDILVERWLNRENLDRCGKVTLIRDVLNSEADIRLGLLLR